MAVQLPNVDVPFVFETLAHHAAYQLAVVIGQRGILRAEIAHLPIVAQEQAHGNFVHKLAFSATGNACDREHKTTLELDQLGSRFSIDFSVLLSKVRYSLEVLALLLHFFLEPASKIP